MKSTNTFGVRFVARIGSSTGEYRIYARITVNKKRLEISLRKTVASSNWDHKAGRACGNRDVMRQLNP